MHTMRQSAYNMSERYVMGRFYERKEKLENLFESSDIQTAEIE